MFRKFRRLKRVRGRLLDRLTGTKSDGPGKSISDAGVFEAESGVSEQQVVQAGFYPEKSESASSDLAESLDAGVPTVSSDGALPLRESAEVGGVSAAESAASPESPITAVSPANAVSPRSAGVSPANAVSPAAAVSPADAVSPAAACPGGCCVPVLCSRWLRLNPRPPSLELVIDSVYRTYPMLQAAAAESQYCVGSADRSTGC
jgi:hypothetical protein